MSLLGAKSTLRDWTVPETTKLTWATVETVEEKRKPAASSRRRQNDVSAGRNAGPSGVGAGLLVSGGLGTAKRSRLLPEVFDGCSHVGRRLSPCGRAIVREMNESVFVL